MAAVGRVCDEDSQLAYWRAEAERWRAEAAWLRAEVERWRAEAGEAERLRAQVAELQGQVTALTERVSTLAGLLFGTSSEKSRDSARTGASASSSQPEPGPDGQRRRRGQQPGASGHGRRDYSQLPTEEQVHDVGEDERVCPRCGAPYAPFDEECCEQIDWQVRLVRIVHRRPSYRRTCRCPVRGVLIAPPPAKPIPKGRFTVGFCARLLTEKYVLGRPLHRIVAALEAEGLAVAEGSLVGVLQDLSQRLAPLAAVIGERNATCAHHHIDETSWQVFAPVAGKANNRWWLWVFVAADTTVFRIERSRSTAVLREHFDIDADADALPAGRRLLISADFWTAYQCLATLDGVDPLWCWAHIRRYFIRAGEAHAELADWAHTWVVERIGRLYLAHAALAAAEPGTEEHAAAEAQFAAALERIDTDRRAQAADPALPAPAAKVLATLDHEWDGLARHREFPELALDNNTAERALRNPVVGRKNYYGSGAVWAAELASRVWTITATATRAGLNPLTYLSDYLTDCAHAGGQAPSGAALSRFCPWQADPADLSRWRAGPA